MFYHLKSEYISDKRLQTARTVLGVKYNDIALIRKSIFQFQTEIYPCINNSKVLELGPAVLKNYMSNPMYKFVKDYYIDAKEILEEKGNIYNTCDPLNSNTTYPYDFINIKGSNKYDYILAFDVLEHMKQVWKAPKAIHRLLKDTGIFYFTVPFMCGQHDNINDYWRFTPLGIVNLFGDLFDIYINKILWKKDDGDSPIHLQVKCEKNAKSIRVL